MLADTSAGTNPTALAYLADVVEFTDFPALSLRTYDNLGAFTETSSSQMSIGHSLLATVCHSSKPSAAYGRLLSQMQGFSQFQP